MFSHRTRKARGTVAERELVHKFWTAGWAAFRAPASGSMQHTLPDVIAGHGKRKLAIEAKITSDDVKYFKKQEVEELQEFSGRFGSEAWLAVKFLRREWRFLSPEDMRETAGSFVISYADALRKGFTFEELVESL